MMAMGIVERLAAMVSVSRTRVKVSVLHPLPTEGEGWGEGVVVPDGGLVEIWGLVLLWSGNVGWFCSFQFHDSFIEFRDFFRFPDAGRHGRQDVDHDAQAQGGQQDQDERPFERPLEKLDGNRLVVLERKGDGKENENEGRD